MSGGFVCIVGRPRKPSTNVLTPPKLVALREVARDSIYCCDPLSMLICSTKYLMSGGFNSGGGGGGTPGVNQQGGQHFKKKNYP